MRAGRRADDTASVPGRESRCVMYIPREWAEVCEFVERCQTKSAGAQEGRRALRLMGRRLVDFLD